MIFFQMQYAGIDNDSRTIELEVLNMILRGN